ncbi:unnamed protein product [Boreogadus saida]
MHVQLFAFSHLSLTLSLLCAHTHTHTHSWQTQSLKETAAHQSSSSFYCTRSSLVNTLQSVVHTDTQTQTHTHTHTQTHTHKHTSMGYSVAPVLSRSSIAAPLARG